MKNFSDLLATDLWIKIEISTRSGSIQIRWPLCNNLNFGCFSPIEVKVDGMDVLEFGYEHEGYWHIQQHQPFYQWRHHVTGQGWLLNPVKHPG